VPDPDDARGASGAIPHTIAKQRSYYPAGVYALTVLCALGLASVALGVADGWVLIAAGVSAIAVSLVYLHLILERRRPAVALRPLSDDGLSSPNGRS
jgi:hypothetical protein